MRLSLLAAVSIVASSAFADGSDAGAPLKGSLDKEVIRGVMQQHTDGVMRCAARQLRKHVDVQGRVTLQFRISPSGTVSSSEVASSSVSNPELEKCLVDLVATYVFPKPAGGGEVVVNYPYEFKGSPDGGAK